MEQKYQVTQNIFYNFLGQFFLLAIGIVSAPFIIHRLGNDLYGIYSILTVVIGYFSILDLGLGAAIIKYISEYSAQNDRKSLEKIIGNALSAYILIGIVGGGLIILLTKMIVLQFLHIPSEFIPLAISAFYLSGLGFFVTMVLTVFNAIPNGLQRMDISNSRNVLFGVLNTLGVIGILLMGQSLISIVLWNILTSIIATFVFIGIIFKLLPQISLKPQFDPNILRKLLNFGGFKFLSNISGQIIFQLDRFLIGIFNPIGLVTFYVSPLLLVQKGFSAMLNITNAVFPAVSFYQGQGDLERVKEIYLRMNRLILFLMLPIFSLLIIFSEQIISLWLGAEFVNQSVPVLRILALAYIFSALSAAPVIISDGLGKPQISAYFGIMGAVINLVLALILIPQFGIKGAALAMLINSALMVPIMILVVNNSVIKINHLVVLKESMLKVFLATAISLIISLIFSHLEKNNLLSLFYGIAAFGIIYLGSNLLLKTFNQKDILALKYLLGRFKLVFSKV